MFPGNKSNVQYYFRETSGGSETYDNFDCLRGEQK